MRPSRFFGMIVSLPVMLFTLVGFSPAQTFHDLIDFTDSSFGNPEYVTLAQSRSGYLYGTTAAAPLTGLGEIFGTTTSGQLIMQYTGFDYDNGYHPGGGVTLAANGSFYGTVVNSLGNSGVIYSITADGNYTVLYQFDGQTGSFPYAPPIQGSDGNFYGTTNGYPHGAQSTIYQYQPQTGVVTLLHSFGNEVALYYALTQGADGDLYAVASTGGSNQFGSIVRLSKTGLLRYVYEFPGGAGGSYPVGPLVQLSDGNFYGVADNGGTGSAGFVFKMTPAGTLTTIYNFTGYPESGYPITGLTLGSDGQLYGVSGGGTFDAGTMYRISPSGQFKQLYNFHTSADTLAPLVQHTNGTFYGVSFNGGANDFGMMYSLNVNLKPFIALVQPQGKAAQIEQILGQGFTGTTTVTFNGSPAPSFTIESDTYMTAVVPSGATTGKVVVTTPSGALTSNVNFRIIQ